jgi:hypothetical protein
VDDGDREKYTLEGRDGELKLAGREDDPKKSVMIDIDERVGYQVFAEVPTTRIRGLRTEDDIEVDEGRILFPRWV